MFAKADCYSPLAMKKIFLEFSAASGLVMNPEKSQIFICGVSDQLKNEIVQLLGFSEGALPVRYLGVPLISARSNSKDCLPIVQNVRQRIDSWVNKSLSYAGRVQLVNAVLFHLQVFWSGVFIIPSQVMKQIEACCRNFVWTGTWSQVGIPLVSWKQICLPRNERGLGVKQLREWNRAFMSKHVWNLVTEDKNLWTIWMKNKMRNQNAWAYVERQDSSFSWRQILKMRGSLQHCLVKKIGDGRETSLFFDKWLEKGRIVDLVGGREYVVQWGETKMVADWRTSHGWSIPASFQRQFPTISAEIHRTNVSHGLDEVIWTEHCSGKFSVSSCYQMLRRKAPKVSWSTLIWDKFVLPRHAFIWWLVVHGKLKTKTYLHGLGLNVDTTCSFCGNGDEDINHSFFGFSFTKMIYKQVLQKWGVNH